MRRADLPFWMPLAAAAVVRLLCLWLVTPGVPPIGDSNGYLALARHFREQEGADRWGSTWTDNVRPPGYTGLISLGLARRDHDLPGYFGSVRLDPYPGVYLIQIACDLAACALLMAFARRAFGRAAGIAAGWVYGLQPATVLLAAGVALAEPVAALFAAAILYAFQRVHETAGPGAVQTRRIWVVVLGALVGVAPQVKEILLLLGGAAVGGLLLDGSFPWRARAAMTAAVAVVAALVIAPWTAFTWQRYGMPLPTGSFGHLALMYDNVPDGQLGYEEWQAAGDLRQRVARARSEFHRFLGDPRRVVDKVQERLRVFVGPETTLPINVVALPREGFMPPQVTRAPLPRGSGLTRATSLRAFHRAVWRLPGPRSRACQWLIGAGTWLLLAAGFAGLVGTRGAAARLAALHLAVFVLVVALTVSLDRYRHNLMPVLAPFAGLALAALFRREGAVLARPRLALAVGAGSALLLALTLFVLPPP